MSDIEVLLYEAGNSYARKPQEREIIGSQGFFLALLQKGGGITLDAQCIARLETALGRHIGNKAISWK